MGLRVFDKKFGPTLVQSLSTGPAIYLFHDADGKVLYVGKAKNIRRRLQTYRNASRKKVHRKMRTLVREAATLEVRPQDSEQQALLEENALIRQLRPPYNVDGAFAFLYPSVGIGATDAHTLFCFSTSPEAYDRLPLRWFGSFRSRPRAKEAFEALVELLAMLGHLSKRTQLPAHERVRGSRLVGVRQLPRALDELLAPFFAGEGCELPGALATALLAKPRARHEAARVEERLRRLDAFYESDARKLRLAMERLGRSGTYVSQDDRDALFILARFEADSDPADARE